MRYVQLLVTVGTFVCLGLTLTACGTISVTSRPTGGLLIEPGVVDVESVGGVCLLRGDLRPLVGTVRIDLGDRELVWVERPDGTPASVRWPMGFWLDRDTPAVRDGSDQIVARDGAQISVDTRDWNAKGTSRDPFILVGDINGKCYG